MVGIVWMVGLVCKFVGYGMFDIIICMVYIIYIYIDNIILPVCVSSRILRGLTRTMDSSRLFGS